MRAVVSPHAQCRVPEHSDAQTKQATPAIKVASESDLLCFLLLHMELRSTEEITAPIAVDDVADVPPILWAGVILWGRPA